MTVIDAVVSAVDHKRLTPVAVKVEEPQLSATANTGADGIAVGFAVPEPFALVQPATVCVTV